MTRLPHCSLAFLFFAAAPAAQEAPAPAAPVVITHAPEGLQLTPALVNGLLAGTVRREVEAAVRDQDPDWPPVTIEIRQDESDLRQPSGYFSGKLVLGGRVRDGGDPVFQAIAKALERELQARMHDAPLRSLESRLEAVKADLASAGRKLSDLRQTLARSAADEAAGSSVAELRHTLQELELQLRVEEPLVEVATKQAAELEDRLQREVRACAEKELRIATLEERAGRDQQARQELIEAHAGREHRARLVDQLSGQVNSNASQMQERTSRLLEMRMRIDGLRDRVGQASEQEQTLRQRAAERTAAEAEAAALEARVDLLRGREAELVQAIDHIVPVRVQLWR
jgi:chromosome segregation ATPase